MLNDMDSKGPGLPCAGDSYGPRSPFSKEPLLLSDFRGRYTRMSEKRVRFVEAWALSGLRDATGPATFGSFRM